MLSIAFFTTLLLATISHAAPGVNQTLSFEGRLTTSSGSVVPDGYYNLQFKIYQDGDGTTAGDTGGSGGTLKWTETYINNGGTSGVQVTNGFFSVNLGSVNPFGSSIDWNQDTLWLSMNVAGSASACTTFGTSPCSADGEMLPMKRITSTPYSLNSGQLGGKTADNFVQLAQGVQTDASSASSIFIDKTSTGNLVQLQNAASDVFTVGNTGDISFGNDSNKTIAVAAGPTNTAGKDLTIASGAGGSGTGANGGTLNLQGGAAGGSDANGGNVVIQGGTAGSANGNGGSVQINASAGTGTGTGGTVALGSSNTGVVSIGSGSGSGTPTLLTLDKASTAPTVSGSAFVGSIYYDTTLNELQCYEGSSWGACTASPDTFVTLSPTYANAVVHSTGTGTITTDLCSDALNINNGTSSQPTICGANETYNYYNWTSSQITAQTRSIYVTYKLPTTFKNFVAGSTSLMGLTDSTDATVAYQLYRNNGSGLTACGSSTSVSTGTQTTWQQGTATSTADPSTCSFAAGDSLIVKVDLTASNNANAYASTLGFTYSNN